MAHLTFKLSELQKQIALFKDAKTRPAYGERFESKYYPDGVILDKSGRTQEACDAAGDWFEPDISRMSQVPHQLWLVGDQGIYLMSNASHKLNETDKSVPIVYANECNPETMDFDEWYDAKNRIFGGDDGVETISIEWVERAARYGATQLTINITPSEIKLVL